ncbi:2-succinyl-5-enolpyruvyl-6-hydroxy-3-cyclohexene-1-carboxylic-acid synthase [Myxococcota bacterium]|nr:2-succinyl-5-enolpyruvyl-6-hydroxy-3-cyclohexene-1-carboxylic-acid synthase [Myxococcota bacterium]
MPPEQGGGDVGGDLSAGRSPVSPPGEDPSGILADLNFGWAAAVVDALLGGGVTDVVLSPGSRSAPLAVALAADTRIRVIVEIDERSGGYRALGLALATGRPVALACTSGTAAANYLPAVVEASLARVPLVVMTADRPPELQDCGAPQTVDQVGLFGGFVRGFRHLPLPSGSGAVLASVRGAVARSVSLATAEPAGPVHLDVPFREPLSPRGDPASALGALLGETGRMEPPVVVRAAEEGPAPGSMVAWLAERIRGAERPLLVAGPQPPDEGLGRALTALADRVGIPLVADAGSPARFLGGALAAHDALARCLGAESGPSPDLVIRVGGFPTSKALRSWLEAGRGHAHVVVDAAAGWRDPSFLATTVLRTAPAPLVEEVAARLDPAPPSAWARGIREADRRASEALGRALDADPASGAAVARAVVRALGARGGRQVLFAASSMAIRDLDGFGGSAASGVRVLSNRGANGIDGTLASAVGAAAAGSPVTAYLGDLAFVHDIGAMRAATEPGVRLDVVVVDDGGGSIFRYLPIASAPGVDFERLFVTPHRLDLARIAEAFGAEVHRVGDAERVEELLRVPCHRTRVVHVAADAAANVGAHRRAWAEVRGELGTGDGAAAPPSRPRRSGSVVERRVIAAGAHRFTGWRAGRGPARLVMLHGFAGGADHFLDLAEALGDRVTSLALDLPGHGGSPPPDSVGEPDVAGLIADLAEAARVEGFGGAAWLGYSMGGRIALHLAAGSPDDVAALVLVGCSPGIADPAEREARRRTDEAWARLAETLPVGEFLDRWGGQPLLEEPPGIPPEARRRAREVRLAARPGGLASALRDLGPGALPSLWGALPDVAVPALLVSGARDARYTEITARMAALMPRARRAIMEGAGHAVHLHRPGELAAEVADFLDGAGPLPTAGGGGERPPVGRSRREERRP